MNEPIYFPTSVSQAAPEERAAFVRRTYGHLTLALAVFVGLEFLFLNSPVKNAMFGFLGLGRWSWLVVLLAFMGISKVAQWLAASQSSIATQYAGLGLFVVAEALIFVPILAVAQATTGTHTIAAAGLVTWALFGGLTAVVFVTRKDFSFLRSIIAIGGLVALGIIVASLIFGFNLGTLFAAVMVLFAAGAILYETSNVLHHYHQSQHVAASLALFASVATLFWYVLRIFMGRRG